MKKTIIIDILLGLIFVMSCICFAFWLPDCLNRWKYFEDYLPSTVYKATTMLIFHLLTAIASIVVFVFTNPQIFHKQKKDE